MGGYVSKDAMEVSCEKSDYDEIRITGLRMNHGVAVAPTLGRCFIEVTSTLAAHSSRHTTTFTFLWIKLDRYRSLTLTGGKWFQGKQFPLDNRGCCDLH